MQTGMTGSVVVIEDEMFNRAMVSDYLQSAGINCIELEHSLDVFDVLEKHQVEMILLDIMLPYQDGFEALRQIRSVYPDLPVITMSSSQAYLQISRSIGASDTLLKPFKQSEMLQALSKFATKNAA